MQATNPSQTFFTGPGGEVLAYSSSTGTVVPLTDLLGSTVALTDSGKLPTQYKYEPFGVPTMYGAQSSNYPYLFAGMEYDPTGLYHTYARYYHPRLQRFLSEDPLQFAGGDVNLFGYTGNDPVNRTDRSGLIDVPGGDVNGPNGIADLGGVGSAAEESDAPDLGDVDDYTAARGNPESGMSAAEEGAGVPATGNTGGVMGISMGPQGGIASQSHAVSRNPVGRGSLAAAGVPQSEIPYSQAPMPALVPVQFPFYNYCGPGNNGGPADPGTDSCCKAHDDCYGQHHLTWLDYLMHLRGMGAGPEQKMCDRQLCDCVKRLGGATGPGDFIIQGGVGRLFCY